MCRENNVKTQWKTVTCFCNFSGLLSIKSTISLLTEKQKNSMSLITESKKTPKWKQVTCPMQGSVCKESRVW